MKKERERQRCLDEKEAEETPESPNNIDVQHYENIRARF